MQVDLDSLNKNELERLKVDVDKALSTIEERQRNKAFEAAQQAAKQHGFTLSDLVAAGPGKKVNLPKYRNPADASQTWTGRGRKPRWLVDALENGHQLDDFAI